MKVLIVGAGSVGASIARELHASGHEITIIDSKPETKKRANLPQVQWFIGDACELSVLKLAVPEESEVVVAATGDDKANLMVSLLCRSEYGVPRTVARVNNPRNEWLFDESWGVDVAVSTPRLMTALVEEAVEVGDVVRLQGQQAGGATLVEYTVPEDHPVIGYRVDHVQWPTDTVLTAILRDGAPIAPSADVVLEGSDELFFITTIAGEDQIRALFA